MLTIETLIINDILVLFPILIYQYYSLYNQNLKREKNDVILSITLFISLYLSIIYKDCIPSTYQFVSIITPLIIAFIYKKSIDAFLMSLILGEYLVNTLNYSPYITLSCFICLYIIYYIYNFKVKSNTFLINMSILIITLTLIANMIISNEIIFNLISIIIYIINIKIISFLVEEADNIMHMHTTLKEFEKEKNLKLNLFKITHEIKNPLCVVKGYLDMFNIDNKEKSIRYLSIINSEVNRTLNLLDDFKEFSKIKLVIEEICLNELFEEVKDIIVPFFLDNHINYTFEIEEDVYILGDYNRLKQVILNILKNAAEANSTSVKTVVFTSSTSVFVYVKDNGSGMDKEVLEKIKEPFYTTKPYGTGLGVSLSKEIINAHKGTLFYSSKKGKGTTCKIRIPL